MMQVSSNDINTFGAIVCSNNDVKSRTLDTERNGYLPLLDRKQGGGSNRIYMGLNLVSGRNSSVFFRINGALITTIEGHFNCGSGLSPASPNQHLCWTRPLAKTSFLTPGPRFFRLYNRYGHMKPHITSPVVGFNI